MEDSLQLESNDYEAEFSVLSDPQVIPESIDTADMGPDDRVCVAMIDNNVIGYLWVSHRDQYEITELNCEYEPSGSLIWRVYVDPEYRRRGIARQLVMTAVKTVRQDLDISEFVAFVAANNFPSRQLFETLGFRPTRQLLCVKFLIWEFENWTEL